MKCLKTTKPWPAFFFAFAVDSAFDENDMPHNEGISDAQKSMVLCGLPANGNGRSDEWQLKPEIQSSSTRIAGSSRTQT